VKYQTHVTAIVFFRTLLCPLKSFHQLDHRPTRTGARRRVGAPGLRRPADRSARVANGRSAHHQTLVD